MPGRTPARRWQLGLVTAVSVLPSPARHAKHSSGYMRKCFVVRALQTSGQQRRLRTLAAKGFCVGVATKKSLFGRSYFEATTVAI